jgi:metallo-beta-lactamase class B
MAAEEIDLIQSGGKIDFQYGAYPEFAFDPVQVDQVLRDGEAIRLGDVSLTARLTPGHTKGSTTFIMRVVDGGKAYTVVFPNSTTSTPAIGWSEPVMPRDRRQLPPHFSCSRPKLTSGSTHCDVFDFEGARSGGPRPAAWVDPSAEMAGGAREGQATVNAELGSPTQ